MAFSSVLLTCTGNGLHAFGQLPDGRLGNLLSFQTARGCTVHHRNCAVCKLSHTAHMATVNITTNITSQLLKLEFRSLVAVTSTAISHNHTSNDIHCPCHIYPLTKRYRYISCPPKYLQTLISPSAIMLGHPLLFRLEFFHILPHRSTLSL
jgi:hypothetical protein